MAKPLVDLDEWAVHDCPNDQYTAPELIYPILSGRVMYHPLHDDGKMIETSEVISCKDNIVETKNTYYRLIEPSEGYKAYCEENGFPIDPDNPVKFKDN